MKKQRKMPEVTLTMTDTIKVLTVTLGTCATVMQILPEHLSQGSHIIILYLTAFLASGVNTVYRIAQKQEKALESAKAEHSTVNLHNIPVIQIVRKTTDD